MADDEKDDRPFWMRAWDDVTAEDLERLFENRNAPGIDLKPVPYASPEMLEMFRLKYGLKKPEGPLAMPPERKPVDAPPAAGTE